MQNGVSIYLNVIITFFIIDDNCWPEFGISRKSNIMRFTRMRDALNRTGRPIYYSMCNWGQASAWEWY